MLTPRPYQLDAAGNGIEFLLSKYKGNGVLVEPTGCHGFGTEVLMYNGTVKRVEDVRIGDQLMGPDSLPRTVLRLCRGQDLMYRISPLRGGDPFDVNSKHVLSLLCTNEQGQKTPRPSRRQGGEQEFIDVDTYLTKAKSWKHIRKLHRSGPVRFAPSFLPLPLPPWIIGVLLGDGHCGTSGVSVTTADQEIVKDIHAFAHAWWLSVRESRKPNNRAVSLTITKQSRAKHRMQPNPLRVTLAALGMDKKIASNKLVPHVYKVASIQSRLELLAGLLDTDGSLSRDTYDFISKSAVLASDVTFIARSLGLRASLAECQKTDQNGRGGTYYRVCISGDIERIPCRIKRKQASKRRQKKNHLVSGFSVTPLGHGDFYGFELDKDHLYLTADFMVHHNSGKSLMIALMGLGLADHPKGGRSVVFQPSEEILDQNAEKFREYGYEPAIFSASKDKRQVGDVTLATIGTVWDHPELFEDFAFAIPDEAHLVNASQGRYQAFRKALPRMRWLGVTASPWRMATNMNGTELRFLTRSKPRIFNKVVHYTQIKHLVENGWWAKLDYKLVKTPGFNRNKIRLNSNGSEYDQKALQLHLFEINWQQRILEVVKRAFAAGRRNMLLFTPTVEDAEFIAREMHPTVACVSEKTPKKQRRDIVERFKAGELPGVANCGVFVHGLDHPGLECVVDSAPSLSLSRVYQKHGRGVRPHPDKEVCWIVDMVDSYNLFGRIDNLMLYCEKKDLWYMAGRPGGPTEPERKLTNEDLTGGKGRKRCPRCQSTDIFFMRHHVTGANATLSRPPEHGGPRPNIVLRKVPSKTTPGKMATVYEIVKPDHPDYHLAEFVNHAAVCKGNQK